MIFNGFDYGIAKLYSELASVSITAKGCAVDGQV